MSFSTITARTTSERKTHKPDGKKRSDHSTNEAGSRYGKYSRHLQTTPNGFLPSIIELRAPKRRLTL